MTADIARMKELILKLDLAAKAYYQGKEEILSNLEYDELYDELEDLEKKTGVILAGSLTQKVGYEVLSELPKEAHESPMLSLDKTKEVEALVEWVGQEKALISWKLDGLTIVLTYRDGKLFKAVTRGNGEIGEVITNNAKVFQNIPLQIPHKNEVILRGEAVIGYKDFEKINEGIENPADQYKNPRNLCSGSVRQLNNEITAKRRVNFFAFNLVKAEGITLGNSREEEFKWLKAQGFGVVEYKIVTKETVAETVEWFSKEIEENSFPSDGLVILYDDIAYGKSLGRTSKFPRDSIAFKWADEIAETKLVDVEWSPSRTGLINPVAIFEPVELEGTTVSRASLHNISVMKGLELGIGDTIKVYKANMIIPQVAENETRSGVKDIPSNCPACGGETKIQKVNDVEALYCLNPDCKAKKIKAFTLFVSRDALNIDGLSEATLEKFLEQDFLQDFSDIYKLSRYEKEIVSLEGFGEKSYQNLMTSIENSRKVVLYRVLYGLGILNIGLSNAKMICKSFGNQIENIINATGEQLSEIDGIGEVIANSFQTYFQNEQKRESFYQLLEELELEKEVESETTLEGEIFVITGSVEHFANRSELKTYIEAKGGKVTGSVTSKTTYLINNDKTSNSSKNKKARELGISIISEEEFLEL